MYFSYLLLIGDDSHTFGVLEAITIWLFCCCYHCHSTLMANDSSYLIKAKIGKCQFRKGVIN